jgi:hypothetical protein
VGRGPHAEVGPETGPVAGPEAGVGIAAPAEDEGGCRRAQCDHGRKDDVSPPDPGEQVALMVVAPHLKLEASANALLTPVEAIGL